MIRDNNIKTVIQFFDTLQNFKHNANENYIEGLNDLNALCCALSM